MSQQILTQYAPLVKVSDIKMIPVAALGGQTRDGKDEIIIGAGNMVFDPNVGPNGMWLPVTKENRLPVEATLTGQTVAEQKTNADAVAGVVTFGAEIEAIEILNLDTANHGVFTVNGISITVPRGSSYRSSVGGSPSATVSVSGSTSYEIRRLV